MNLERALAYDPFAGDEGYDGDRCLRDELVRTRTMHWCHMCDCGILRGEVSRVAVWIFAGELTTYRWCQECCEAMAKTVETDDMAPVDRRYALRAEVALL